MTLTAGEWFALGFGLGVITTWVWLLVAAVFPRMWSRWQHRDRDK